MNPAGHAGIHFFAWFIESAAMQHVGLPRFGQFLHHHDLCACLEEGGAARLDGGGAFRQVNVEFFLGREMTARQGLVRGAPFLTVFLFQCLREV